MPTLKERVEVLEKTVKELQEKIKEVHQIISLKPTELIPNYKEVKGEIEETVKIILLAAVSKISEILNEICRVLEEEIGVSLTHIQKQIKIL